MHKRTKRKHNKSFKRRYRQFVHGIAMQMSQPGVMSAAVLCLCVAAFLSGLAVGNSSANEGNYDPNKIPLPQMRNESFSDEAAGDMMFAAPAPENQEMTIAEWFADGGAKNEAMPPAHRRSRADAWAPDRSAMPEPWTSSLDQSIVAPLFQDDDEALPTPITIDYSESLKPLLSNR